MSQAQPSGTSPEPSATTERTGISAAQLRAMWRTASRERGWSFPDDWWTPAVDAVAEAVVSDGDITERCTRLGLARARAGVPMSETLDDVLAMASLVQSLQSHPAHRLSFELAPIDGLALLRATAIGWSEEAMIGRSDVPFDTMTTLADYSYLSIRLGEVAAEVESRGARLSAEYALVVSSLLGPSQDPTQQSEGLQERVEAWDITWQMTQLADDLRTVFSSGETIVQAGPTTAIVLAPREPELTPRIASLRTLIESRRIEGNEHGAPTVGIWVEGLPDSLRQVRLLLADLRR